MKTQLLPHYFRKLGLAVFAIGAFPASAPGFMDGFTGRPEQQLLSKQTAHILEIIAIAGIVIYAFSKEKVYDELLQRLRLEAIKLTFVASMAVIILAYIFFPDFRINPSYLINLQVFCFIGIYYCKKENIVSAVGQERHHA